VLERISHCKLYHLSSLVHYDLLCEELSHYERFLKNQKQDKDHNEWLEYRKKGWGFVPDNIESYRPQEPRAKVKRGRGKTEATELSKEVQNAIKQSM
jgi:hypothetical protein